MMSVGGEKRSEAEATLSVDDLNELMKHRGEEARDFITQNFGSPTELCRLLGSDPIRGECHCRRP